MCFCYGETGAIPVRARRRVACSIRFSTGGATASGTRHWSFREGERRNAESKYPDRNAPSRLCAASAGFFGRKYKIKEKKDAKKKEM